VTQPWLRTARLALRPRSLADTAACLAMDAEPGVTDHVDGPWDDPAAHRALIEERTLGPWPPGMGYWAVERDGAFAGWVCLVPIGGPGSEVEVGWRLRRPLWGQGIATEAAGPLLRHGFATLGLPRVVVRIAAANAASLRVAARLGFPPPVAKPEGYLGSAMAREEWTHRKGGHDAPAC
jgi:RimJ/RimL family protein N-acetyltransferase